jgi:hypothetical protein
MSSTRADDLRKAVEAAVQPWPASTIPDGSDLELESYLLLAQRVEQLLPSPAPVGMPPRKNGVIIVGHVGAQMIDRPDPQKWNAIRDLPTGILADRVLTLVQTLQGERLLSFDELNCFLAAFYSYHGFFNMAKVTRPTCADPTAPGGVRPLTLPERMHHYRWLEQCWRGETERGNLWVEYGVSLTRFYNLKQQIIDDWIPLGSPFWND